MAGGEGKRGSSGKVFVVAGMVVAAPLLTVVVVLLCLVIVLLQCLFDRFGSVFPQCGLMVFPGVVIVSR